MAAAIAHAPQVRACDAALQLGCSLSPELSQLLSTSRGNLNNTPRGADARSTKARVVSYIPGDDGTAHHREIARKTTRPFAYAEAPMELQPPVQLDFDPEEVFEYASNPLTGKTGHVVERGALWLDGKATSRVDDIWRGFSAGFKATPLLQGPGSGCYDRGSYNHACVHPHGAASAGGHGSPDVLVRVVDCPLQGMPEKASEGLATDGPHHGAASGSQVVAVQRASQFAILPLPTCTGTGSDAAMASGRNIQGTPPSPRCNSHASTTAPPSPRCNSHASTTAACRRPPARRPASAGAATAALRKAAALTPTRPTTPCPPPRAKTTQCSPAKPKRPVSLAIPAKGADESSLALLCGIGLASPRTPRSRCQDVEIECCLRLSDSMMQISSRCWDLADIMEKRQLVRGAVQRAGEVSSLIQHVRRQRALSRPSSRSATHTGGAADVSDGGSSAPSTVAFPAFRSEQWIKTDFDKIRPPPDVLEGTDLTPEYMANYPTAGLFPGKVAQVREQIRTALFRQALFKVQNVEVTYMEECRDPRVIMQIAASSQRSLLGNAIDWWNNPKDVELLRDELWTINRCGHSADYNVRFYKEGADGFSSTVRPTGVRDMWNALRYYIYDG